MFELTELQRDALMESFNICVGRSARSMSQLMGSESAISVPMLFQTTVAQSKKIVDPSMRERTDVCVVHRNLHDGFIHAFMIFQGSDEHITSLTNISSKSRANYADKRESSTAHILSMVTESIQFQLDKLIGMNTEPSDVKFISKIPEDLFSPHFKKDSELLLLKIDMVFRRRGVAAYLLLVFTQEGLQDMIGGIDNMLKD